MNGWYSPGLHGVHVMAVALLAEKEPTWHSPETAASPSCAQNLPGSQGVQEDVLAPEGEYEPAGHQPDMAVNPVPAQYFPGSHDLQLLASVASWYVPAGHRVHVEGWPVQCEPAGHVRGPEEMPTEAPVSVDV